MKIFKMKNFNLAYNLWTSGDEPGEIRSLGGTKSGSSISNIDDSHMTYWTSTTPSLSRNQLNICFSHEQRGHSGSTVNVGLQIRASPADTDFTC